MSPWSVDSPPGCALAFRSFTAARIRSFFLPVFSWSFFFRSFSFGIALPSFPISAVRLTLRGRRLAGFDHLLEAAQVLGHLLLRLLAKQLGDRRPDHPARRVILQRHRDLGPASARRVDESHLARVAH